MTSAVQMGDCATEGKMSVHDLQMTILHQLGLEPFRLTYAYQGLQNRLIGPEGESVVRKELLRGAENSVM